MTRDQATILELSKMLAEMRAALDQANARIAALSAKKDDA